MLTKLSVAAALSAGVSALSTVQASLFLQENFFQQPNQLYTPFA